MNHLERFWNKTEGEKGCKFERHSGKKGQVGSECVHQEGRHRWRDEFGDERRHMEKEESLDSEAENQFVI